MKDSKVVTIRSPRIHCGLSYYWGGNTRKKRKQVTSWDHNNPSTCCFSLMKSFAAVFFVKMSASCSPEA